MPKNEPLAVVKIDIELREGGYYDVTSKDVPGLYLFSKDINKIASDIIPAIKALFKMNKGLDVEVLGATDASNFPAYSSEINTNYVMFPTSAVA